MADEEIDFPHNGRKAKKRRLPGACDTCRRRKVKCDSALMPGISCTTCVASYSPCSHAPRQPNKKETQQAYIRTLEERMSKIELVFRTLHPDKDIATLLDLPLDPVPSVSNPGNEETLTKKFPELKLKYPAPCLSPTLSANESVSQRRKDDSIEEEQDLSRVKLPEHLNKLFVEDKRFFGPDSTYMFAQYTMHAKMEASGIFTSHPLDSKLLRRPVYWQMRSWELSFARSQGHLFDYPEPDLLDTLVTLYFEKSNIIIPVLHRPTFLHSLKSGLHHQDSSFGMTVLLVCAIASRFTSDNRVFLDDDISGLSSGWKYYCQVPSFRSRLFERCTLYDLQCYVLSVLYLLGTSTNHIAWPLIGLGIRFAQEKGLHRRNGKQKHTVEEESEKRVFWSLIFLDRWVSAFHGRPCAMHDEEFDLEYPVECDDEYWEPSDSEKAFQQPPGKPCQITCFILLIKLVEMLAFTLRTLYATKKSKMLIGFIGNEWESHVVAELDSSMNKWKDSLPHFLRWNPENPEITFFCQSIALHTSFNHLQIQIHRPFLMKRSALSLTSLAMCTSAARSTAHVLEIAMSRGAALFSATYMAAFAAGLVLLHAHWAHPPPDTTLDSKTTMELVRKIFLTLKDGERKWHPAGRFVDLMQTLGCPNDHRSNPKLAHRRELEMIEPPINKMWELASSVGPLQRQIAASKLGPPALIQPSCSSMNSWDTTPQMFMSSQADNTPHDPITQTRGSVLFPARTNSHPLLYSQGLHTPQLLVQQLQLDGSTDDANSMGNLSEDLFAWSIPLNSSPCDWNLLSDVMRQGESRP